MKIDSESHEREKEMKKIFYSVAVDHFRNGMSMPRDYILRNLNVQTTNFSIFGVWCESVLFKCTSVFG